MKYLHLVELGLARLNQNKAQPPQRHIHYKAEIQCEMLHSSIDLKTVIFEMT